MTNRLPRTVDVIDDYLRLLEWEDFIMQLSSLTMGTLSKEPSEGELRRLRFLSAFDCPWKEFIFLPVNGLVLDSLEPLFAKSQDKEVGSVPYLGRSSKQNGLLGKAFVSKNVLFDRQARSKILAHAESLSRVSYKHLSRTEVLVKVMFEACGIKSGWLNGELNLTFADSRLRGLKSDRRSVIHNGKRLTYLELEGAERRLSTDCETGGERSSLREVIHHYCFPDGIETSEIHISQPKTRIEEPVMIRCARASKFLANMIIKRIAPSYRDQSMPTVPARSGQVWIMRGDRQRYVNAKEIRIVGLRRTGNHALINWIQKQAAGSLFLNDLRVDCNPYLRQYISFCADSKLADSADPGELFDRHDFWLLHSLGFFSQKELLLVSSY